MQFFHFIDKLATKSIEDNSFQLIQEFCDTLPFGVYIREFKNFNFIFLNEKLVNILGYEKEELIDTNLFMYNPDFANYHDNFISKLKNKSIKLQKVKVKNKNGNLITLLHSFNIIQTEEGEFYSVGVLVQANNANESPYISTFSNNYELKEFFDFIKVPTAFVDRKVKQIIHTNTTLKEFLSIGENENRVETINKICFQNISLCENYEIFVTGNYDFWEFYVNIVDNQGNSIPSVCILNKLPETNYDILFLHPVLSENADVQAAAKLPEVKAVGDELIKSNFITLVSHEFRTPLTKILLAADLLMNYEDRMTKEDKTSRLNEIKDTVYGMTKLMEAVMTVSRMEQNLYKMEFEYIDLRVFFEMILDGFMVRNRNELLINFKYDSFQRFIAIEMTLLTLIANNIIDNATKFAKPNSKMDVLVKIQNDLSINFEVKDEGIGIPENEIEMVYNSFFKASNNQNIEGYGLGLFITKKSLDLLKGKIEIKSKVNEGTTVCVTIPPPPQPM